MRILLVSASYTPVLGGLQTVVSSLAQHFCRQGHSACVVTNRYPRSLPAYEVQANVPIHRWLFLTPDLKFLCQGRLDLLLASFYFYPLTRQALFSLVKSFRPDIVNFHFPDAQTPFVLYLRRRFKFKLVVSLHGDEILRFFVQGRAPKSYNLTKILREADVITACSKYILNKATQLEPLGVKKGKVIYNGVDLYRFKDGASYACRRPYIFAYGRLTYEKGFDILLEAFSQVVKKNSRVDLILAGTGEEEGALKAQIKQLGLEAQVCIFGRATPEEVIQLLNGSQFVIVPSRREPFGIVILEAMAAGKTVVATRSGGPGEIIDNGVNGILIEKEDLQALTEVLIRVIGDRHLRQNIAAKAKDFSTKFSNRQMAANYLEVYK